MVDVRGNDIKIELLSVIVIVNKFTYRELFRIKSLGMLRKFHTQTAKNSFSAQNIRSTFVLSNRCRRFAFSLLICSRRPKMCWMASNESSTFHSHWRLSINEPANLLAFIVHLVIFFKIQFFSHSLSLSSSVFLSMAWIWWERIYLYLKWRVCDRSGQNVCISVWIPLNNVHFHYDLQPLLRCRFEFLIPFLGAALSLSQSHSLHFAYLVIDNKRSERCSVNHAI